jgi:hypothetical protein
MSTSFAPLRIRRALRDQFTGIGPPQPFGPDGWSFTGADRTIIVTCAPQIDGNEWVHASIAAADQPPGYAELKALHAAVFGAGYAYQCFVPATQHVNIHEHALHLWGRLDGRAVLPEFALDGSI